jgi:hypothetical protein
MASNMDRIRENIQSASTEDLLDRVTAFRQGMEPEAVRIAERELANRGVTAEAIARHREGYRGKLLVDEDGLPYCCSQCHRPAEGHRVSWVRLFWLVPLFPILRKVCSKHLAEDSVSPPE